MNTQTQKIAVIIGGSRGLGRNTAENLARKGVDAVAWKIIPGNPVSTICA